MVKAVAQLEQELAALDQTVAAMAQAFHETYQQYLTALGQATRQQLILASYHICTRGYPEQFTALSLPERQTLQQTLRQLAQQAETEMIGCLAPITSTKPGWVLLPGQKNPFDLEPELDEAGPESDAASSPEQLDSPAQPPQPNPPINEAESAGVESENANQDRVWQSSPPDFLVEAGADSFGQGAAGTTNEGATNEAANQASPANLASAVETNSDQPSEALAARSTPASAQSGSTRGANPPHPKQIAQWQSQLEAEVVEVLQNISHATNQVLQQTGILPNRLPEPILEVAAKADLSSETTASPPNLLNLLVEADAEDEKSALTQVIAVRLRLAEIEFGDAATAAQRSKLRHLTAQLVKLGREYQRKQKERAIAEAEAAWRTSWYERQE